MSKRPGGFTTSIFSLIPSTSHNSQGWQENMLEFAPFFTVKLNLIVVYTYTLRVPYASTTIAGIVRKISIAKTTLTYG